MLVWVWLAPVHLVSTAHGHMEGSTLFYHKKAHTPQGNTSGTEMWCLWLLFIFQKSLSEQTLFFPCLKEALALMNPGEICFLAGPVAIEQGPMVLK